MSWLQLRIYSEVLGRQADLNVLLPEVSAMPGADRPIWDGSTPLPTLYLLHGFGDDASSWMRFTSLERQVQGYPMAVVLPAVGKSFYTNQVYGDDYQRYIGEEVVSITRKLFRLAESREATFLAGVSMVGYGAKRIGLQYRERFGRVASFSGALDISEVLRTRQAEKSDLQWEKTMQANFGDLDKVAGTENDLFVLLENCAGHGACMPKLLITIGTEDFLYQGNQKFREKLDELKIAYSYVEKPGGHVWRFWDREMLPELLQWLPVKPVYQW